MLNSSAWPSMSSGIWGRYRSGLITRPAEPTRARLRIRSRWAARSSLMAKATVSSNSPSASQLIVSGDSRTFTQVIVRSRPLAPASTSPLLNPPSAIASRTVSAMGGISMPQLGSGVKDQKYQELLDGLHNGRVCFGLLAFHVESTGVDGDYSPPEWVGSTRAAAGAASRVVPREAGLSSLQPSVSYDQASCHEGTDGQLHKRNSRTAAPRDPGAAIPDRRRRDLHGGADGRGRQARRRDNTVRA